MILAKFQACYPTGSLISELLTIYQGKFVVRVLVQIDGVTRATGMAAAQTPELAEDEARIRALAIMVIDRASVTPAVAVPPQSVAEVTEPPLEKAPLAAPAQQNFNPNGAIDAIESLPQLGYSPVSPAPTESPQGFKGKSSTQGEDFQQLIFNAPPEIEEATTAMEDFEVTSNTQSKNSNSPSVPVNNDETSLFSLNYELPSNSGFEAPTESSEPIDLSEDLVAIEFKLEELGWSPDQEIEYLERTYGKSSRQQLTAGQVQEFRRYLDLFSQTTKELRDLKWNNQKGRDYLIRTYNKRSRQQLTHQELQEFLEYLQAERRH